MKFGLAASPEAVAEALRRHVNVVERPKGPGEYPIWPDEFDSVSNPFQRPWADGVAGVMADEPGSITVGKGKPVNGFYRFRFLVHTDADRESYLEAVVSGRRGDGARISIDYAQTKVWSNEGTAVTAEQDDLRRLGGSGGVHRVLERWLRDIAAEARAIDAHHQAPAPHPAVITFPAQGGRRNPDGLGGPG